MVKVGDKIKIIYIEDAPDYSGKVGVITHFNTDCYGEVRIGGTWGGLYVYPNLDKFEIIG